MDQQTYNLERVEMSLSQPPSQRTLQAYVVVLCDPLQHSKPVDFFTTSFFHVELLSRGTQRPILSRTLAAAAKCFYLSLRSRLCRPMSTEEGRGRQSSGWGGEGESKAVRRAECGGWERVVCGLKGLDCSTLAPNFTGYLAICKIGRNFERIWRICQNENNDTSA